MKSALNQVNRKQYKEGTIYGALLKLALSGVQTHKSPLTSFA
jgi:hypothetical protein